MRRIYWGRLQAIQKIGDFFVDLLGIGDGVSDFFFAEKVAVAAAEAVRQF